MTDFDKHFQKQIARDKQQKRETFNKIMTDIELIHKRQLRIYIAKRIGLILLALAIMFGLLALINHYDLINLNEQGLTDYQGTGSAFSSIVESFEDKSQIDK